MRSHRTVSHVAGALAGAAMLTLGTAAAVAHPHVWVSVEATVVFEQGSIVGFRHRWTFDEFYTAMAIQGLDTNNDGIYSREELAELAQVNIDGLTDFKFFTFARLGNTDLAALPPKDYWLEHTAAAPATTGAQPGATAAPGGGADGPADAAGERPGVLKRVWRGVFGGPESQPKAAPEPPKVLALEFTLPLRQAVLADAPEFTFAIYDPSWFIAFEVASDNAVKLGAGAPEGCRITSGEQATPGPTADDARRLEDAFNSSFGGAGTTTMSGTKLFRVTCDPKS
jgi:ABC-type uncharacterized transport system substrate-binding protein